MSTHTITGHLYHVQHDFQRDDEFQIEFTKSSTMGQCDPDWTLIREQRFEVEVPDDFDPRPSKLAALEAKKSAIRAVFLKRIEEVDEQITKLQALEFSPEVVE